jgi:hypothetical protein
MIAFFDTKKRVETMRLQRLDVRGIGTAAVFGDDALEVRIVLAQFGNEPFRGIAFTIIFVRTILPHNRFGHQWNHCTHVRMDNRRAQHLVVIRDSTVAVDLVQTRYAVMVLEEKYPVPSSAKRARRVPRLPTRAAWRRCRSGAAGGVAPGGAGKRALKIPLLADDVRAFKDEVIRPLLGSRIKQRYERPCFRVKRANITPLPAIAQRAGQGEVVEYCLPSMLVGNHMVHLVCRGGKILMEQTVFTAIPCSLNYLTPEICCGPKCTSSTLL